MGHVLKEVPLLRTMKRLHKLQKIPILVIPKTSWGWIREGVSGELVNYKNPRKKLADFQSDAQHSRITVNVKMNFFSIFHIMPL